jgi:hypothetical protein
MSISNDANLILQGKCPKCKEPLVFGRALKWCKDRRCNWSAPKSAVQ